MNTEFRSQRTLREITRVNPGKTDFTDKTEAHTILNITYNISYNM